MPRKPIVATQIVEILSNTHSLSVPDLLSELVEKNTKVNKTSVYRALEKLAEQGVVCKNMFTDDEIVWELRERHHDHLVCTQCGVMKTVPCETSTPETLNGFTIDHHHTTFFGICSSCQAK